MPRQRQFNKKTSTTYALVNRPQHDPLIHDSDAPSQIFTQISGPSKQKSKNKILQRADLEEQYGQAGVIRDNEGEAAEYGIYFDDTDYDYMQHLRELGGATDATWVEAPQSQQKRKAKEKQSLEDALREVTLKDKPSGYNDDSLEEPSSSLSSFIRPKYQDQQDVPDVLSGFQPDMDPRLREVLEALDDEEYVDDDDEIFAELAGEGHEEVDQTRWENNYFDDEEEEDGWETDETEKPSQEYNSITRSLADVEDNEVGGVKLQSAESEDGDWMASFTKAKATTGEADATRLKTFKQAPQTLPSDLESSSQMVPSSAFGGRKKKRKGALTGSTGFSMTSSSVARTEAMSTLDARFDRIANYYMDDADELDDLDDGVSLATASTNHTTGSRVSAFGVDESSEAPKQMPANFDSVMDEFLGGSGGKKARLMKKGGNAKLMETQDGLQQLAEIRSGLGPARVQRQFREAPKT